MPLVSYGVLIGQVDHFERDQPNNYGQYFHGHVFVTAPSGLYRCAVDVYAPAGMSIHYKVQRNLPRGVFANLIAMPDGYHDLARNSTSGALDYIRSPLLRKRKPWRPPKVYPLNKIAKQLGKMVAFMQAWRTSSGVNALNAMEPTVIGATRAYVFGAPFTGGGLGMHDVHMNQGDPPGQFYAMNGIWQDGAVIVERPGGELRAFLVRFNTQSMRTDDNGHPI